MDAQRLPTRIEAYLDARAQLEQRRSEVNDVEPERHRLDQVRRDLHEAIVEVRDPRSAPLVAAVHEHLAAEAAFDQSIPGGEAMELAARRLESARIAVQEALRAYVEEMAPVPRLRPDASSAQKRILVAIDDSESAGWALQVAGELAQALSARLALLHVVRPVLGFGRDFMAANRLDLSRRQEAAEWLHRMQRRLSPAITSECMLKTGSPAEQILAAAQEWKVDLLVIGRRGRGKVARCLSPGTSESVTRKSACPVVTVGREPNRELVEDDEWFPVGADCVAPLAAHHHSETRNI